jgi:hypothetical protein
VSDTAKTCSGCKSDLPLSSFSFNKNKAGGRDIYCRTCKSNQNKRWRVENPEYIDKNRKRDNERSQKWGKANPDRVSAAQKKYCKNNPRKMLAKHLKRKFAMDVEVYEKLLEVQNNTCKICGCVFLGRKINGPCVDHDHCTGKVRGLLCRLCNSGLGGFRDNIGIILRCIDYLEKSALEGEVHACCVGVRIFNRNHFHSDIKNILLENQRGKCKICDTENCFSSNKGFNLDHDHLTGKIRGVLCNMCNLGLGHFQDSISRLIKAIEYLKLHNSMGAK